MESGKEGKIRRKINGRLGIEKDGVNSKANNSRLPAIKYGKPAKLPSTRWYTVILAEVINKAYTSVEFPLKLV